MERIENQSWQRAQLKGPNETDKNFFASETKNPNQSKPQYTK